MFRAPNGMPRPSVHLTVAAPPELASRVRETVKAQGISISLFLTRAIERELADAEQERG